MSYFLHVRSSFGRQSDHEPYETMEAAQKDAEVGAKQVVGEAIKAGISLEEAVAGKAFEIVDESGNVVASLPFIDLINAA